MAQVIEAGALARASEQMDLPWRVVSLINIFRLLAPMVLLLVFFFNAPNYTIGWRFPGMFLGVCAAWFSVGVYKAIPWRQSSKAGSHWWAFTC